jgi:uncharacterized protein YjiS (DUF1127 family)
MFPVILKGKCDSVHSLRRTALKRLKKLKSLPKSSAFRDRQTRLPKGTTMPSLAHTTTSYSANRSHQPRRATVSGLLRRLVEKIAFELEVRRSLREVQSFDDKMLRDIGLQRGGIEHALRNGVADISLDMLRR